MSDKQQRFAHPASQVPSASVLVSTPGCLSCGVMLSPASRIDATASEEDTCSRVATVAPSMRLVVMTPTGTVAVAASGCSSCCVGSRGS